MSAIVRGIALSLFLATAASAASPQRIVSTAPSITETLYELGLGSRVVGVTNYCTQPADARTKPKIGTFLEPDFERILSLKPDLVLVIKNPVQVAERLRKLGLRAEEINQDLIGDVLSSITRIGQLTGTGATAGRLVAKLRADLDAVKKNAATSPRRRTLFLVGRSPGTVQGMVGAGPGTFINELMNLAGGDNVLAQAPIQYPKVSLEQVLATDPDVILDMGDFAHVEGKPLEPEWKLIELWSRYGRLRAVKQGQVRQINSDFFIRPGPRMGDAARELDRLIHGARGR